MTASAQECLACSADINLITAAKLLAKLQQLWCYSVWLRVFWRQLQLTFCTSRWPQSYQSSMSALLPKADISSRVRGAGFDALKMYRLLVKKYLRASLNRSDSSCHSLRSSAEKSFFRATKSRIICANPLSE